MLGGEHPARRSPNEQTEARKLESFGGMRALVPGRGRLNSAARCAAYLAPVALLGGTAGFYAFHAPRSPRAAPVEAAGSAGPTGSGEINVRSQATGRLAAWLI